MKRSLILFRRTKSADEFAECKSEMECAYFIVPRQDDVDDEDGAENR